MAVNTSIMIDLDSGCVMLSSMRVFQFALSPPPRPWVLMVTLLLRWTRRHWIKWAESRITISKTVKLCWATCWRWCVTSSLRFMLTTVWLDKKPLFSPLVPYTPTTPITFNTSTLEAMRSGLLLCGHYTISVVLLCTQKTFLFFYPLCNASTMLTFNGLCPLLSILFVLFTQNILIYGVPKWCLLAVSYYDICGMYPRYILGCVPCLDKIIGQHQLVMVWHSAVLSCLCGAVLLVGSPRSVDCFSFFVLMDTCVFVRVYVRLCNVMFIYE